MEAYVHGVSTRKVDDLVAALGIDAGVSKSKVSRICGELDAVVGGFRDRSLAHAPFAYLFLAATYAVPPYRGGPFELEGAMPNHPDALCGCIPATH